MVIIDTLVLNTERFTIFEDILVGGGGSGVLTLTISMGEILGKPFKKKNVYRNTITNSRKP